MNPSNTEKRLDDSLVLSRHNLWGEKWNQQLSATICCGLTKSLNIQGEKLIIADEVIYFKTIRRAVAGSASNDKARHSLLQSRSGKTSEDTDKSVPFYHFPEFQEILSKTDNLDRVKFFL